MQTLLLKNSIKRTKHILIPVGYSKDIQLALIYYKWQNLVFQNLLAQIISAGNGITIDGLNTPLMVFLLLIMDVLLLLVLKYLLH